MNYRTANDVQNRLEGGYSLVELIVSLILTLVILGIAVTTFSSALGSRSRESSTTDAITSAQAALNIMTREIGNAGYGLSSNGIVVADSGGKRLRIRTNTDNKGSGSNGYATSGPGEDVTFFYDSASQSVVRYDRNVGINGTTSGVINRVSDVDFEYTNYALDGTPSPGAAVAANTGRVTIILKVILADIQGQPTNRIVQVKSDVALRNSTYQLGQY